MYSNEQILQALEYNAWDMNNIPPEVEAFIDTSELVMLHSKITYPYNNWVLRARFDEQDVSTKVEEIISYYESYQTPFIWCVGPGSTPEQLGQVLERRGFQIAGHYVGLAVDLSTVANASSTQSAIQVKPVRTQSDLHCFLTIRHPEMDTHNRQRLEQLRAPHLTTMAEKTVIAYIDEQAVGTASFHVTSDGQIVYLGDAYVLPDFRGRGIYQALIRYRLQIAIEQGCLVAISIANIRTSAPILEKWGFKSYGAFTEYKL